ncbi:MAG: hypothetical protein MH137_06330 [Flavobacteriales bacterium]|nr:hypothetical protein [Flavobacteriales bacterium]
MGILLLILGLLISAVGLILLVNKQEEVQVNTTKNTPPEKTKPAVTNNKEKGDAFEDFVIQKVGSAPGISFTGKNSDYHKNGISATENKEPDLKFTHKNTAIAVECKWRKEFVNGKIDWAKDYQVENYHRFEEKQKCFVFIAIGIGGEPGSPNEFYLVPLYRLTKTFASREYISEYMLNPEKGIRYNSTKKVFVQ